MSNKSKGKNANVDTWYVTKTGKVIPVVVIYVHHFSWGSRAKVRFPDGKDQGDGFWVDHSRIFPSREEAQKLVQKEKANTNSGG